MDQAPPYYLLSPDGSVQGLAVEVLREAARRRGIQLEWVPLAGPLDVALRQHMVDLWPIVGVTPARRREFHLTEPWIDNDFVLLSLQGTAVATVADTARPTDHPCPAPGHHRVSPAALPNGSIGSP